MRRGQNFVAEKRVNGRWEFLFRGIDGDLVMQAARRYVESSGNSARIWRNGAMIARITKASLGPDQP